MEKLNPAHKIKDQYKQGSQYKTSIGEKGIYEQSKINERFYVGDQWYGVRCGNDRPLVRRNVIKRIGEYKLSSISAAPVSVNFSADGIPENTWSKEQKKELGESMISGEAGYPEGETTDLEISVIMKYLSDYFRVSAERTKLDVKKQEALRNAYISGTGIMYAYWDDRIKTGMYVDEAKQQTINGDVQVEVLKVENVVFGDPNNEDVQTQPYIIVSQRRQCDDVIREARRNKISKDEIEKIKPDSDINNYNAGTRGEQEQTGSKRTTVYTKFYKEWDEVGKDYKVMCVRCTENVVIREPWDMKIKLYPIAKMCWIPRFSCAYGDSEITYQIPNQIAINRSESANVWSIMTTGMPITVVAQDYLDEPLTNSPGQIIEYTGDPANINNVVRHIAPPAWSAQMTGVPDALARNTLQDNGANDAALGNIRPENASAIVQIREAAMQPMQLYQNRFYNFIEDIARIFTEFWLHLYGNRMLKVKTENGYGYVPFEAKRYESLIIDARVDVGAATLYSEAVVASSLDALLNMGVINKKQYFSRYPDGMIPNKTGLLQDVEEEERMQQMAQQNQNEVLDEWAQQNPEMYAQYQQLPPEKQQEMLQRAGV